MQDAPKLRCGTCSSTEVAVIVTMPNATMYKCETCGDEWTILERDMRRPGITDRTFTPGGRKP